METTITDYTLPILKLFLKLDSGEDFTEECEQIKAMPEEDSWNVLNQLFERIGKDVENSERVVEAIKKVGDIDPDYVDDFAQAVLFLSEERTPQEKAGFIRQLLGRTYTKTMFMPAFLRSLTLIAINCQDNELLAQLIQKLEQAE